MASVTSDACIFSAALAILQDPDPQAKAAETHRIAELWQQRRLSTAVKNASHVDRPGRDDLKVKVVAPGCMHKIGKGGSLSSRQAILHSLVHIESWAVDLSWDVIERFGSDPAYSLPDEFISDFVQVAADEASHFQLLQKRLEAVGSHYGALPVHDGLWESAAATAHSLPARLAVESCVHEARGLDRLPHTIQRFQNGGDRESADLLKIIYQEEIAHCAAGVRWLTYLHKQACADSPQQASPATAAALQSLQGATPNDNATSEASGQVEADMTSKTQSQTDAAQPLYTEASKKQDTSGSHAWQQHARQYATVETWFHALVKAHFKGSLKPPFNGEARAAAGFGPSWYLPLAA